MDYQIKEQEGGAGQVDNGTPQNVWTYLRGEFQLHLNRRTSLELDSIADKYFFL